MCPLNEKIKERKLITRALNNKTNPLYFDQSCLSMCFLCQPKLYKQVSLHIKNIFNDLLIENCKLEPPLYQYLCWVYFEDPGNYVLL